MAEDRVIQVNLPATDGKAIVAGLQLLSLAANPETPPEKIRELAVEWEATHGREVVDRLRDVFDRALGWGPHSG